MLFPRFRFLSNEFLQRTFGVGNCLFPFVGADTSKLSEQLVLRDLHISSAGPVRE